MKIWIEGQENFALSKVRGVGSYRKMLEEAISEYGKEFVLELDKDNCELVIHPGFFPYGKLRIVQGVKNILVIHDLIPLQYKKYFPAGLRGWLRWLRNKSLLQRFNGFLTDTEVTKSEINKLLGIEAKRIEVVYPAAKKIYYTVNKNSVASAATASKLPSKYVLYVGDVTWNKNLPRLAKAIQKVNLNLVLVGKALLDKKNIGHPWQKSLKEFYQLVGQDKRFIFLGYLNEQDLIAVYKKAKAVVLPSLSEGFGLPWLEAALLSVPVIVSKIPVFIEVTRGTSIYVDPYSVDSIASAIEEVYYGDNRKTIISQRKRALEFSQKSFVNRLTQSLYNLVY